MLSLPRLSSPLKTSSLPCSHAIPLHPLNPCCSAIGEAIKNVAGSYKPHFAAMASVQNEPVYKPVKSVVPMSADLHEVGGWVRQWYNAGSS